MESDMDDTTDTTCQSVEGGKTTSQVQQGSIGITIEDLQSAFDIQNQYIKAALDAELDKRFPAEGNIASKVRLCVRAWDVNLPNMVIYH